jgi:hypothetical protein
MSRSETSLDINKLTGTVSNLTNATELDFAIETSTRGAASTCLVPRLDFLCAGASYGFLLDTSLSWFGFAPEVFTRYMVSGTGVNVSWRNGFFLLACSETVDE